MREAGLPGPRPGGRLGGDLEQRLHSAISARPDDPELQYAAGEWLSRMSACGCGKPELFRAADEVSYLAGAERGGVLDSWSLFRLGHHRAMAGENRDAIVWFERALALDPEQVDARYNEAVALLVLKEYAAARRHSARVLGKYRDPALDADAHYVHGAIEAALGALARAEAAYRTALERKPGHAHAFQGLLALLRAQARWDEYERAVTSFVALDFANTYPFRVYLESVSAAGAAEGDRRLARSLVAREYGGDREVGAVFYSLGLLAERLGDRAQAHAHYTRSLEALRRLVPPPESAVAALESLVQRTRGE